MKKKEFVFSSHVGCRDSLFKYLNSQILFLKSNHKTKLVIIILGLNSRYYVFLRGIKYFVINQNQSEYSKKPTNRLNNTRYYNLILNCFNNYYNIYIIFFIS